MMANGRVEIRPRTTGEILDDAWRLVLADAPTLLALSTLFSLPAVVLLLLLVTRPSPTGLADRCLLPALTALALLLTGLGSGGCQEAFRRSADGHTPHLGRCLLAALRRGLDHLAARAVVLVLTLLGLPCLLLPGLAVWVGSASVHPLLAGGEVRWLEALRVSGRETQRHAGKAAVVTLSRLALLAVVVINLHLFIRAGLWIMDQLAGFDMALPTQVLTPFNPVYDLALILLAWLLLAPYAEACNYLLHVDARARYEGLDLWYRGQRLFPAFDRTRAGAVLLVLAAVLLGSSVARADDARLSSVRTARARLAEITQEVKAAEPYRGTDWQPALNDLADQLQPRVQGQPERYRWFAQAIKGFARLDRTAALAVLTKLDQRLALVEESLEPRNAENATPTRSKEEIKGLLSPNPEDAGHPEAPKRPPPRPEEQEIKRPAVRDDASPRSRERPEQRGLVGPRQSGGAESLLWMLLLGLAVAGVVFLLLHGRERRAQAKPRAAPVARPAPLLDDVLSRPDRQTAEDLWRRADELARTGQLREAVRTLYLAVLALLHRANHIRYERTRTNGEYVHQLRARTELHQPFERLTALFEVKWYGERSCTTEDYQACHGLAEAVRAGVGRA
jgi:hypothetical protein